MLKLEYKCSKIYILPNIDIKHGLKTFYKFVRNCVYKTITNYMIIHKCLVLILVYNHSKYNIMMRRRNQFRHWGIPSWLMCELVIRGHQCLHIEPEYNKKYLLYI